VGVRYGVLTGCWCSLCYSRGWGEFLRAVAHPVIVACMLIYSFFFFFSGVTKLVGVREGVLTGYWYSHCYSKGWGDFLRAVAHPVNVACMFFLVVFTGLGLFTCIGNMCGLVRGY
jgi:hypothetical protein